MFKFGLFTLFKRTVHSGPKKPPPIFTTFTKPTSENSIYDITDALTPVPSDRLIISQKYAKLSQDHRTIKYAVRGIDNWDTHVYCFPEQTDFFILGGGLMGSAVAYYIKKTLTRCADLCLIDKDPYSTQNVTSQCPGLLSFQSKNQDHVRMANMSKELIRNLLYDPLITKQDIASLRMRPVTHLVLWENSDVEDVIEANGMQIADGCHVDIKIPRELEVQFPWLQVVDTDVAIGSHSNQDDLIIDPVALRNLYRVLAQAYGANFIQAEMIDFNMTFNRNHSGADPRSAGSVVVRLPTGELKHCDYGTGFISAGHNTPLIEDLAVMDAKLRDISKDTHFLEPRMRITFVFRSEDAPLLNFPAITDTDGTLLLRDYDLNGVFHYHLTLKESENILFKDHLGFMNFNGDEGCPNLIHRHRMLEEYFYEFVKPRLVKRIPIMKDAIFQCAKSGFQNVNSHDGFPLVTLHPYFGMIGMAGGFGARLLSYAPTAAISMSELLMNGEEETFDVTNLYWNRIVKNIKMNEFSSLIA